MSKVRPTLIVLQRPSLGWVLGLVLLGACGRQATPQPSNPADAQNLPTRPTSSGPEVSAPASPVLPVVEPAAPAPPAPPPAPVPQRRRAGRDDGPLPYLVVEPAAGEAALPTLIALHGRGDRAENFARFAAELGLPVRTIVPRPPLPFGASGGRQWFDRSQPDGDRQILARVDDLLALVDALREADPGAPPPVLLGFSQGAMLAMQVAARHPDRVRGVVALSGALVVTEGNARAATPVPMLLTLGQRDAMVTPERTRAAADALRALGHAPEVFEFDGAHQIPPAVVDRVRAFVRDLLAAP